MGMMDETNDLLKELLVMINRSNRILMMVNVVNICTICVLLAFIIRGE